MSDGKVVFDITGNLSGINSALNSATNAISRQTAKWTVLGQTAMNALTSAGRVAFNAVKDLAANAFEYNAQMETYEVNFKTLLGSAEASQLKMAELKEYAAKTPFAFTDLAEATQTMLAFNLTSDESALALKHIGDISLGDANKLKSLTLAFSQVSSAGKLAGQDLLQMINAGFNPLQVIAEKTGASYADLKAVMSGEKTSEDFQLRMEAARKEVEELGVNASESAIMLAKIGEDGMISADMVAAAMRIVTSEGGAFYKALESASDTAKGQIATIQDSWDMLTGKVTGGVFDKLSTEVFPKVIGWLDELNAAYDKDGFAGLKEAGGTIFDEMGQLALNTGSGIIAQLYNGITGDTKSGDEIKAYLSGLWTDSSAALTTFTDAASGLLGTIWRSLTGQEPTKANIMGTIGGLFDAGVTGANDLLTIAGTFMADLDSALGDDTLGTGGKISAVFTAGYNAMKDLITAGGTFFTDLYNAITGSEVSSEEVAAAIGGAFTTVETTFGSIATNISTAVTKVKEFFTIKVPEGFTSALSDLQFAWNGMKDAAVLIGTTAKDGLETAITTTARLLGIKMPEDYELGDGLKAAWNGVTDAIDGAAISTADLLGIEVPDDFSICDEFIKGFQTIGFWISDATKKLKEFYDTNVKTSNDEYVEELTKTQEAEAAERDSSKYAGKYAHLDEATKRELGNYAYMALQKGTQSGLLTNYRWDFSEEFVNSGMLQQFQADLSDALSSGTLTAEGIDAWFEDAQGQLQSQLDNTHLSVGVRASLTSVMGLVSQTLNGLTGVGHASGGLFTSATRFLGADGMHTFGESGTEVLLPLDALWRKMGMMFDSSFASNLDWLQYSVMPQLPAATPAAGHDDDLAETIAAAVREALSGLTVEMDKRTVGKMLVPVISKDIADDVNGKRWTA